MGLLQAGGGACARWGGSVTSFRERNAEHVRAGPAHRRSAPRSQSHALLYRHGLGHLGSHFYMGLRTIALRSMQQEVRQQLALRKSDRQTRAQHAPEQGCEPHRVHRVAYPVRMPAQPCSRRWVLPVP